MKRRLFFLTLIFVSTYSTLVGAQEPAPTAEIKKIKVDARKPLRLDYQSKAWNKNSSKSETSALLVRDSATGRLAKIVVTETGPDTSLFVGYYQLSFDTSQASSAEMTPEIYVVNESILSKQEALKNIDLMIKDGKLLRKPYFYRTESRTVQAISVYDSKEQAFLAYEDFLKTGSGRPIVDRAALEAQRAAQLSDEQKKFAEQLLKAETERKRLEDDEKRKSEEMKKKQASLATAEKEKRKAQAKTVVEKAMAMYRLDRFAEAETFFQQAIELDPENQTYYFQYGVTKYKSQQYNKSIALLNMAEASAGFDPVERDYYIALNHLKLKENALAYKKFIEVKNKDSKVMSPAAGFFAGVIDFQAGNYDSAKVLFEYVIDNSSDTQLDAQGETYIEQIANIRQFEELQKKKFFITAVMGMMYDSNILAQDPNQTSLDLAGIRWSYGGSVEYRAVYTQKHEFSATMAVSDLYSLDKTLKASADLQNADPLSLSVALPYVFKTAILERPYRVSVSPGYETVQMNLDRAGSREVIVNSAVFDVDQTLVASDKWYSALNLEYRSDQSLISATDDENQSATKLTLMTSQTVFVDDKNSKAWTIDIGYANNNAKGVNQKYNRVDLGAGYFMPLSESTTGTAKMTFYQSSYGQHTTGRSDSNIGLALSTRTPMSEILSWNNSLSYNKNTSSLAGSTYDRWTIGTTFSWAQNF